MSTNLHDFYSVAVRQVFSYFLYNILRLGNKKFRFLFRLDISSGCYGTNIPQKRIMGKVEIDIFSVSMGIHVFVFFKKC